MTKADKIITLLLVVCILCLTAVMDTKAKNAEKKLKIVQTKLDSVQRVSDSIQNELLYNQIELGRYETAYKILLRRNSKAANQYGNIISEETE